jgi:hypothetical protein
VLTHVSHLDLWNNPIGPDGARALADSLFLSSLTELELPGGAIGPEGATALADSFVCQRLKSLRACPRSYTTASFGTGVTVARARRRIINRVMAQ